MASVNLYDLRPGDVVRLQDGTEATVEAPTQDGAWILVTYANGAADLCAADEIAAVLP